MVTAKEREKLQQRLFLSSRHVEDMNFRKLSRDFVLKNDESILEQLKI